MLDDIRPPCHVKMGGGGSVNWYSLLEENLELSELYKITHPMASQFHF